MNYTIVINGFVWVGCMGYYFLFARRWYTGPRITVDEANSTISNNGVFTTENSREKTAVSGKEE